MREIILSRSPSFFRIVLFLCILPFCILSGFEFPKDHSFHPEYKLEWVYFVGWIQTETGREFGYELSFFRTDLSGKESVYPVHFAISDFQNSSHLTSQTIERGITGLGVFSTSMIQSGDFQVQILPDHRFHLKAQPRDSSIQLDLQLNPQESKPIYLQGKDGISPKSRKYPGIQSRYYSIPRLETRGEIQISGDRFRIAGGESWMDHEWSGKSGESESDKISGKESAWSWVGLWLEDGTDLTVFNFQNSPSDPVETFGSLRKKGENPEYFHKAGEVSFTPQSDLWKSQSTGRKYPLRWKIQVSDLEIEISPQFNHQEFDARSSTGNIYWEGGVRASGIRSGKKVTGKGYLELKGSQISSFGKALK